MTVNRSILNAFILPEPPTNLSVRNDGAGKIVLGWSTPPYDTGDGLLGDAATARNRNKRD